MTDPARQKARLRRIRLMGIIIALLLSIPILLYEISGEKDHLHRVKSDGVLKVITFNGPTTYYEGSQGPNGFEYDLASAFAEHLGVELQVITAERLTDIPPKILAGHVDFAAAGLAPPTLILFGVIDVAGALWTASCLRKEFTSPA